MTSMSPQQLCLDPPDGVLQMSAIHSDRADDGAGFNDKPRR